MTAIWIILAIAVAIVVFIITIYNKLVKNRQSVEEGWSGIDVQLKRRSNLIPNLLAAVKGYMKHEKELLEGITKMRSQANSVADKGPNERSKAEGALGAGLMNLFAVMENYPDLKANQNFLQLQSSWNEVEEQISASRRAFNAAVTNYNNGVETFPSNIMAGIMSYKRRRLFEIPDEERQNVNAKDMFNK